MTNKSYLGIITTYNMTELAVAQNKPIDLGIYRPESSFVLPLLAAIKPSKIPEGQTAVVIAEASLLALPIDAVYPAITSLEHAISPTDAEDLSEEEVLAASPLREVDDYLSSTLSELPEEEFTLSQRELRRRYLESRDNYYLYKTFR